MTKYQISQSPVPWKVFVIKENEFTIELDKDEIFKRITKNKIKQFENYGRTYMDGHSRYAVAYIKSMRREEQQYKQREHESWKRRLDEITATSDEKKEELKAIMNHFDPISEKRKHLEGKN